ncbi:MAG: insulinase family protein, partial [bacterium]|nr:insulinase family protein [bacterium]
MKRFLVALLFFFLSSTALGEDGSWSDKVVRFQLKNGMTFLLVSRGEAPVFNAQICFRVGGVDEEPGKTGLAHLFEHMAFKGTEKFGTKDYKAEKPILDAIEKVGADL